MTQPSPALLTTPNTIPQHPQAHENQAQMASMNETTANNAAVAAAAAAGFGVTHNGQAGQGMPQLSGGPFSPGYNYGSAPNPGNHGQTMMGEPSSYDPMFGTLPTNAFSSPAAWHGEEAQNRMAHPPAAAVRPAQSPGTKSNNGSTTTQGEEKDPFLSLLEQLAENEQRINNGGSNELDFFLTGGATS